MYEPFVAIATGLAVKFELSKTHRHHRAGSGPPLEARPPRARAPRSRDVPIGGALVSLGVSPDKTRGIPHEWAVNLQRRRDLHPVVAVEPMDRRGRPISTRPCLSLSMRRT